MYKDMVNCGGSIVLGSGWMLASWMGRGSTKSQIFKNKQETGSVAFARNYEEKWVGAVDNQLVDINRLLNTRVLTTPIYDNKDGKREIILSVDVARSAKTSNNKKKKEITLITCNNQNKKRLIIKAKENR